MLSIKGAGLVSGEHRRLAALDDVFRAADRGGRVDGEHAAGDQPVEQHADGGEVLLDGRLFEIRPERLDVGGDVQRLDIGQLTNVMPLAPGEEPAARPVIGLAGIPVADGSGEEFQEPPGGVLAGASDRRRHHDVAAGFGDGPATPNRDELAHAFSVT